MPPRVPPSRIAQALEYLQGLKSGVGEFVGGVGSNLADRAKAAGGLAYEALTSDPYMGQMNTAEFSEAAANRQTPRLDQAARDIGTIGKAILTQPVQTGKAIVRGEVDRAKEAMTSPQAAGQYAGSFIDPTRLAAALRHRIPISELDVYHGTPHRFPGTEANPLGEFDASKIGTGEGAQAYGHGIYLAESPGVANEYKRVLSDQLASNIYRTQFGANQAKKYAEKWQAMLDDPSIPRPLRAKDRTLVDDNWLKKQIADEAQEQERLNKWLETKQLGGSLYKADLPDEIIDRMLDWNKPLSEQSAAVRDALMPRVMATLKKDGTPEHLLEHYANRTLGGDVVKYKLRMARNDASKFMQQAGIPGIRYLDAGSRDGGSGTRNFVVFPGEEKKVRILERK